uniref:BsaJI n=1 Tax=Geobacillus stearothermophilus TaxID=1422 RepID=E5LGC0_GEOSE|nr:BsaJI [Geobacillus stearothermophilus]
MTFDKIAVKQILLRLLKGEDYRGEVLNIINADFLDFALQFFKDVALAKLQNEELTDDWYKKYFIQNPSLTKEKVAIYSGLNMKTISNTYKTTAKNVVVDASLEHYDAFVKTIQELIEIDDSLELMLTIKYNKVSVELTLSESLIVMNVLAVKRAAIRGGAWSTAGKRVEKLLMLTLCKLFRVPDKHYKSIYVAQLKDENDFSREIDFYLIDQNNNELKCEVKLMGKGNPESADAVIARDSKIFVADTLSETNKKQLDFLKVEWVELRSEKGYEKFKTILSNRGIPYEDIEEITPEYLEKVIDESLGI